MESSGEGGKMDGCLYFCELWMNPNSFHGEFGVPPLVQPSPLSSLLSPLPFFSFYTCISSSITISCSFFFFSFFQINIHLYHYLKFTIEYAWGMINLLFTFLLYTLLLAVSWHLVIVYIYYVYTTQPFMVRSRLMLNKVC